MLPAGEEQPGSGRGAVSASRWRGEREQPVPLAVPQAGVEALVESQVLLELTRGRGSKEDSGCGEERSVTGLAPGGCPAMCFCTSDRVLGEAGV